MKKFILPIVHITCLLVMIASLLQLGTQLQTEREQFHKITVQNLVQLAILRNYIDKQPHLDLKLCDDKFTDAMGGDAWLKPEYWHIDADGTKHKQTKAEFDKGIDEIFKSIDEPKNYK